MLDKVEKTRELLKSAIEATDGYLGAEKNAVQYGINNQNLKEFMYFFTRAQQTLAQLGILDKHMEYMSGHMNEMENEARKNPTIQDVTSLLGGSFQTDSKKVQDELMNEEADKGLAAKASKSGISVDTLRKVYNRGMAAWRTGHRPGTTPQQWAMARVNSYIMKGKTYHTADKDLREETNSIEEEITDQELDDIVNNLDWVDIIDFYDADELQADEEKKTSLEEAISAQSRIKKKQSFLRTKSKRNVARMMKLRRASDIQTLQKRAKLAARRALYNRFLKGRDKSSLSATEKDRIEKQISNLKNIQSMLAQRMMPKIRSIEQKRLMNK